MLRLIVYPVKLMKSFNFTTFIHHLLYLKLFVDLRLYLVEVDEVGDVALPELVERPHVVVRDPLPRQPVQSHRPPLPRGEVLLGRSTLRLRLFDFRLCQPRYEC